MRKKAVGLLLGALLSSTGAIGPELQDPSILARVARRSGGGALFSSKNKPFPWRKCRGGAAPGSQGQPPWRPGPQRPMEPYPHSGSRPQGGRPAASLWDDFTER
jgi:hypothetical protein